MTLMLKQLACDGTMSQHLRSHKRKHEWQTVCYAKHHKCWYYYMPLKLFGVYAFALKYTALYRRPSYTTCMLRKRCISTQRCSP